MPLPAGLDRGFYVTPTLFVDELIDTSLRVPADGRYQWHVAPSTRPLAPSTEHVLEGSWTWNGRTFTDAITFTTGDGPLGRAPEPPFSVVRTGATPQPGHRRARRAHDDLEPAAADRRRA